MMLRVVFAAVARDELNHAYDWYEGESPGRGALLEREMQEILSRIASSPQQFPHAGDRLRRATLRRYPYVIYFATTERTARIIAFFHTSRDPTVWQRRL